MIASVYKPPQELLSQPAANVQSQVEPQTTETISSLETQVASVQINGRKYSQCNPMPPANILTAPFITTIFSNKIRVQCFSTAPVF